MGGTRGWEKVGKGFRCGQGCRGAPRVATAITRQMRGNGDGETGKGRSTRGQGISGAPGVNPKLGMHKVRAAKKQGGW